MNIDKELFIKLINESPSFREIVVNEVFPPNISNTVWGIIKSDFDKISKIREIRELNPNHIAASFDYPFDFKSYDGVIKLSSKCAKEFTEYLIRALTSSQNSIY